MTFRDFVKRVVCVVALGVSSLGLAAEPAGSPLLANFDFEASDAHAAWKEMRGKDVQPSIVALDADNPHSGKTALKFQVTSEGTGSRFVFTGINVPPERAKRIRVRLYARTAGLAEGEAEINLLERDQTKVLGWCGGKNVLISISPGEAWKEFTAEAPIRAQTRVLTCFIRIQNPAAGKTIWIDDASLEFLDAQ